MVTNFWAPARASGAATGAADVVVAGGGAVRAAVTLAWSNGQTEGQEFAAAAYAEALMQGLDVVVDRVPAQLQLAGDLLFTLAGQQLVQRL